MGVRLIKGCIGILALSLATYCADCFAQEDVYTKGQEQLYWTDEDIDYVVREQRRELLVTWHRKLVDRYNNLLNKVALLSGVRTTEHRTVELPKITIVEITANGNITTRKINAFKSLRNELALSELLGTLKTRNLSKSELDEISTTFDQVESRLDRAELAYFGHKVGDNGMLGIMQTAMCSLDQKAALSEDVLDSAAVDAVALCMNQQKVAIDGMILTYDGLKPLPEAPDEKLQVEDKGPLVAASIRTNGARPVAEPSPTSEPSPERPSGSSGAASSVKTKTQGKGAAKTGRASAPDITQDDFEFVFDGNGDVDVRLAAATQDTTGEGAPPTPTSRSKADDKREKEKKEAEAKAEQKKLLAKVKKEFEVKFEVKPRKMPENVSPTVKRKVSGKSEKQQELNAHFRKEIDSAAAEIEKGQYALSDGMADFGRKILLSEVEDLVLTEDKKQKERTRITREWEETVARYKKLFQSTAGKPFEERLSTLMLKANEDYTRRYVSRKENPEAIFMSQCFNSNEFCNCVGNTKFSMAVALAVLADEKIPSQKKILVQDLGYHLAAVVYDEKEKTSWDMLAGGQPNADLKGNFYHPTFLMNAELIRKGETGVVDTKLLYKKGRQEATAEEERQLAAAGGSKQQKMAAQFDDGIRSSVNLKDPTGGTQSIKTEHQYGAAYVAFGTAGSAGDRYVPPEIKWDAAISDMKAIFKSQLFKEYLAVKQDPTLLGSGKYDTKKIDEFGTLEGNIFGILSGKFHVTGENAGDGYQPLRERLAKEVPELAALYELYQKEREPFTKTGEEYDREMAKFFELFKAIGPENFRHYQRLIDSPVNSQFLGQALKRPDLPIVMIGFMDSYFQDPNKVSYKTQHRARIDGSEEDRVKPKNEQAREYRLDLGEPAMDESPKDRKDEQRAAKGFGKDSSGIRLKPERDAFTKIEPIDFARYIQSSANEVFFDTPKRWTPGLTATLRDEKKYTKDLVEWFVRDGFRKISDARVDKSAHLISGPDTQKIPKDIAVLIVDFLRDKDGTSADKAPLKDMIEANYGSVDKYVAQVRADFESVDQNSAQAKQQQSDNSNLHVFQAALFQYGMDPKILDQAETKSFIYKKRSAESFTMGSPETEKGRDSDEAQVSVTLSPYSIQLTPVTQLQWYLLMGTNPSFHNKQEHSDGDYREINGVSLNINHPVENVSWNDVQMYIQRLNTLDSKCEYRLPTEAEWEAAARAGSKGPYTFDENPHAGEVDIELLKKYAWFADNSLNRTHAVAGKAPNRDGLYDMHGNVWQWTQDWYGKNIASGFDPQGPPTGSHRVLRGGSWGDGARYLRSAWRDSLGPGGRDYDVGFRLVRTCP